MGLKSNPPLLETIRKQQWMDFCVNGNSLYVVYYWISLKLTSHSKCYGLELKVIPICMIIVKSVAFKTIHQVSRTLAKIIENRPILSHYDSTRLYQTGKQPNENKLTDWWSCRIPIYLVHILFPWSLQFQQLKSVRQSTKVNRSGHKKIL